jgi:tetratricopeptide (TPR) repeat protein
VLKELIALNPRQQNYRYQLALLYLGNKQVNEAEGVLRQAVAANPEAPESKLALIDFLATQRSGAQAQSELQGFIDKEPDNYQLRLGLAALHERANQFDKAEAVYREVIERDHTGPQGLTARTRIAVLKIRANQLDEAERLTDEVLKESPRDNDALILRGNIALAQNRPEAAIADLRAALRDQPNSPAILRGLARAHLANGDSALAEESLKSAVEANPKDIDTRMDLARFLTERGESAQAVSLLEKVVLDAPDNVAVREALFRAQAAAKDLGAAARTAEDIKLLRPDQALGYYLAGMIAEAQGKAEAGIHEYEHALALQPDANEPLTAWVRAELALKRPEVAINCLHATIAKYPQDVAVRNVLAEVLISQKNPAGAVAILTDAIARAPQWWQLYRTMAIAQLAAGNRAAAIANYQLGLKAVPGSVELAVDLAALYEQDGRSDEAIRQYEQVLTRNPKSEVLANKLAMLLVTYRKDQASLDRARDLATTFAASTNPAYLDTHGWVQYKRGEFATALPLFEQVADRVPESPLVRYHLAMAQFRNGQLKQARDNLERALGAGKKFAGVEEARATLDEIKKKQSG